MELMKTKLPYDSLMYDKKSISKIFWPMFFEFIFTALMGTVDTMMVASCGDYVVSGVSLVNGMCNLFNNFLNALAVGGGAIIAQYSGRGDRTRCNESAKQVIYGGFLFSVAVVLPAWLFRTNLIGLLYGSSEEMVQVMAEHYARYVIISSLFTAITGGCNAVFRTMGMTGFIFRIHVVGNLLNIAGNAVMIYGFGMEARGAAIATLLCRAFIAIAMLVRMLDTKLDIHLERPLYFRFNMEIDTRIIKQAIPNAVEQSIMQLGRVLVSSLVSTFPTADIAAYSVALNIGTFLEYPVMAVSQTSIPVTARCCGAGRKDEAMYHNKWALLNSYIVILPFSLLFIAFGYRIIGLYSNSLSVESTKLAYHILLTYCIGMFTVYPASWSTPHFIRPAGDVKFTMVVSIASMFVFRVGLAYLLACFCPQLGIWSCWIASLVDWTMRGVVYLPRFLSGKWQKHTII